MPLNHACSRARARLIGRRVRAAFPNPRPNLPVIYVPGIVGSKLHDRRHQIDVWGAPGGVLRRNPAHADYRLRPDDTNVLTHEVLHRFPIVPGLLDTIVTQDLVRVLRAALGYRVGRDLFFLGYDWRRGHGHLLERLRALMRHMRMLFGPRQRVVLIGQSVANLAIRLLVRTGTAQERDMIARWYAFGPPWRGTWHAAHMLRAGYFPAGRRFFGFTPEDAFSYPASFELLPAQPRLAEAQGDLVDLDWTDPACWITYELGPTALLKADREARRHLRVQAKAARALQAAVAGTAPVDAQVSQLWFAGVANQAVTAAVHADGRTAVEARAVARLRPDLLARGDDHVPLVHLTADPCGPLVDDPRHVPWGENCVLLSGARDHRRLINHTPNLAALAFDMGAVRMMEGRHVCH